MMRSDFLRQTVVGITQSCQDLGSLVASVGQSNTDIVPDHSSLVGICFVEIDVCVGSIAPAEMAVGYLIVVVSNLDVTMVVRTASREDDVVDHGGFDIVVQAKIVD